jgi:preprotein translocase subunit SecF
MTRPAAQRTADLAALLALISVVLIAWSAIDPTPLALVIAMTAGQAVGTVSLIVLAAAIIMDLRRARLLSRKGGD